MKKEQKDELIAVILLLLSIYVGISIFTYAANKNPILSSTVKGPLIGRIGMVIAFYIKLGFGWGAYVFPFILLYFAIRIFLNKFQGFKETLVYLLLLFTFSFFFAIIKPSATIKNTINSIANSGKYLFYAGYIGYYTGHLSLKLLGKAGSVILVVIFFLISLFSLTDILFKNLILSIKNNIYNFLLKINQRKENIKKNKLNKEREKRTKRKEKHLKKEKKKKIKDKKQPKEEEPKITPSHITEEKALSLPPVELLESPSTGNLKEDNLALEKNGKILVEKLQNLGINAELISFVKGPTVTRYEIKLDASQRVSQVASMENDIAYALAKSPVRIIAPIPGKEAVGIEVPNDNKRIIHLKEILLSKEFQKNKGHLKFGIGCTIDGKYIIGNLNEMPHLLIAGSTGSGKSVMIKSIIDFLLLQYSPYELRLVMVDPKRVELTQYKGIPHLLKDIIVDAKKATKALLEMVERMEFRLKLFSNFACENLQQYNEYVKNNKEKFPDLMPLPYIVIIIDELADLMMVSKNEVEASLARLAQLARATGIHLIIATQRPSVDVVTGIIKANFPVRIGFRVAQKVDSRTIFDKNGAEALLGRGDLLYLPPGASDLIRAQGPFPTKHETTMIVNHWKQYDKAEFPDWEISIMSNENESEENKISNLVSEDELLVPAFEYFLQTKRISVSSLQTHFSIGFNRAARIVENMENLGLVSPPDSSKKRHFLVEEKEWEEIKRKFS